MNIQVPTQAEKPRTDEVIDAVLTQLVQTNSLAEATVERARRAAGADPRLDKVLLKLGLLEEEVLAQVWSEILHLPRAESSQFPPVPVIPELLNGRFLRDAGVLPLSADGQRILIAISDPLDAYPAAAIGSRTGLQVECLVALPSDIRVALERLYPPDETASVSVANADVAASDLARLKDLATDAPAILLVNSIIELAVELRASDVHLSSGRNGPRLRYRVDGVLRDEAPPSPAAYDAIISRVKVLAELDITERRLPQDGRIRFGVAGREIDLRIATMPHLEGEGAVLRILDRSTVKLDLPSLGFSQSTEKEFLDVLSEPHGIFLVTGPTGSGKTTTLYAALRKIVKPERNIVSVEDPVEYQLDGVAQIQVQRKIGLTFPTALRAILRQDPDVIMIGEIRDSETALIANQAALTGHFVLATLHTNSASASFPRLIDMGLEPYLLSSTIRGSLSQRLVRQFCAHCARGLSTRDKVLRDQLQRLADLTSIAPRMECVKVPIGCDRCNGSGYKGRIAIAEIITVNDDLRQAILRRADASEIEGVYRKKSHNSLLRSGMEKIFAGRSSLAEVLQAAGGEALQ
jgi:general secretion pathway protein E